MVIIASCVTCDEVHAAAASGAASRPLQRGAPRASGPKQPSFSAWMKVTSVRPMKPSPRVRKNEGSLEIDRLGGTFGIEAAARSMTMTRLPGERPCRTERSEYLNVPPARKTWSNQALSPVEMLKLCYRAPMTMMSAARTSAINLSDRARAASSGFSCWNALTPPHWR